MSDYTQPVTALDEDEVLREFRRHQSLEEPKSWPFFWAVGQENVELERKDIFIMSEDMSVKVAQISDVGGSGSGIKEAWLAEYLCKLHNDALVAAGIKPALTAERVEDLESRLAELRAK